MKNLNLTNLLMILTRLRDEVGNHTLNESIALLGALADDIVDNLPTYADELSETYDIPRETAKSIVCRYSGNDYRGRKRYKRVMFNRERVTGPGCKNLLHATTDGHKLIKKVLGKC